MINFSATAPIPELLEAIAALEPTGNVDADFAALAKAAALSRLAALQTAGKTSATINFRVNSMPQLASEQIEIEIHAP